jgi:hypothetical protein
MLSTAAWVGSGGGACARRAHATSALSSMIKESFQPVPSPEIALRKGLLIFMFCLILKTNGDDDIHPEFRIREAADADLCGNYFASPATRKQTTFGHPTIPPEDQPEQVFIHRTPCLS